MRLLHLFWGGSNGFWPRIKRRALWTFLAVGLGSSLVFVNRFEVFHWLLEPAGGRLSPFEGGLPVYNAPMAMVTTSIRLAALGGLAVGIPVLTASSMTMVKPVMPARLWRFLVVFVPVTYACFVAGAAFAYYVMTPFGLRFLLNFGEGIAIPMILLSEYMGLLMGMMLALGVVFETPPAMYLSARMGLLSYRHFRRFRRVFLIAALILAGIISPGFDTINMLMVFIPMVAMYEVGLFVTWLVHPEDGDYLWLKTLTRPLVWTWRAPGRLRRWLVKHGIGWG